MDEISLGKASKRMIPALTNMDTVSRDIDATMYITPYQGWKKFKPACDRVKTTYRQGQIQDGVFVGSGTSLLPKTIGIISKQLIPIVFHILYS